MLPHRKGRSQPPTPRRSARVVAGWRAFRRMTERYRLLTDVLGALAIVGILVGGLAAATGGVWPPVIVVESGSMMNGFYETSYGRLGTIDVGDIVFIRGVDGPQDIDTWADGGDHRYGRPGDVIAFAANGDNNATPVIHRAIAYVEVGRDGNNRIEYRLHWVDGEIKRWGPSGIYFPELGFNEDFGFTRASGFKPAYSGYLTKGDNAISNPATDQALGITRVIEPAWILGEAYGEVPWIGLAKLALTTGQTNPEVPGWERIGNAFAPIELWSMFFLVLAILILVPLSIDTWRAWRRVKAEREIEARMAEENARILAKRREEHARLAAAAKPAPAAPATPSAKKTTTFAAVPKGPRPPTS